MEEIIAVASLDNKYYTLTEDNYEVKAHIIDKSKIKDEFYIAFNDKAPAKIKILRSVDADTVKFIKKVYLNSLFDTYEQAVKRRAKNKLLGMRLKDDAKFLKLIVDKLKLRGYRYKDNLGREVIFLYKVYFRDLKTMQEINMRTLRKIRSANSIDELKDMWLIYTITFKDICGKEIHELFTEIKDYYNDFDVEEIIIVIRNSSSHIFTVG